MSIVAELNQFYEDSYRLTGSFLSQANRDLRAYCGDTWTSKELSFLQRNDRQAYSLNKIRRLINLLTGIERESRKQIVIKPELANLVGLAEIWTFLSRHISNKEKIHNKWSNASEHAFKTGMALFGIDQSYERDRLNGDPKFWWKSFSSFMIDPYFTKIDLSDASRAAIRDMVTKDQIKQLLPDISPTEIDYLPTGTSDRKYQYMGTNKNFNRGYAQRNLVTYDRYWVKDTRKQFQMFNIDTGIVTPLDHKSADEIDRMRYELRDSRNRIIEVTIPTVTLNIIAGNVELYKGRDPTLLDRFPFTFLPCYFEPDIDRHDLRIMGCVRDLLDVQRQNNRRHSQIADIFETCINTGLIWVNGALVDPDTAMKGGQAKQVVLNDNYEIGRHVQFITPGSSGLGSGWLEYSQLIDSQMMEIMGFNEDIAGVSDGISSQISGRLSQIRASNGIRSVRNLFDNNEEAKLNLYSLLMEYIQKNWGRQKVQMITGEDPGEEFYSVPVMDYMMELAQGNITDTQRDAIFNTLRELHEAGIPIPGSTLLKYAPGEGYKEIQEILQSQEQEAAAVARQQAEDEHMLNELSSSQIDHNTALAQEKRARIIGDLAFARAKISQAKSDQVKSELDAVKVLAEIDGLKKENLRQALEIAELIKQRGQKEEEQVISEDLQTREEILNEEN